MESKENNNSNIKSIVKAELNKVDYVSYDNLLPYEKKPDLELYRKINTEIMEVEENDWKVNFNLLNELRRLRKFEKDMFISVFNNVKVHSKVIPSFINSLRSNLAKLALILVSEIFSCYECETVNEWMSSLIPEVLQKSVMDLKGFLKEEANKALHNFSENMLYEESIVALLKGVKHVNTKISENAFDTLIKLIHNYDHVALEHISCWKVIIVNIIDIFNMKKDPYVKRPAKIIFAFEEKLGMEKFDKILHDNLKENNLQVIVQIRKNEMASIMKAVKSRDGRSSSNNSLKQRMKEFAKGRESSKGDVIVIKNIKEEVEVERNEDKENKDMTNITIVKVDENITMEN